MASPSILSAVFGLIIILFCGCSDSENTAAKRTPTKKDKTVSSTATPKYVRAAITSYYTLERLRSEQTHRDASASITITDLDEVKRLASYFSDAGHGKESGIGGGWMRFADIAFETVDGKKVKVVLDPDLEVWAEGHGEWPIADAEKFRPYFLNLLRKELKEPDAKDKRQKG